MPGELKKYYSFALVLSSSEKEDHASAINVDHYVTYIRRLKAIQPKLVIEFYIQSPRLAEEFKAWTDRLKEPDDDEESEKLEHEFIDPDECRGYAARKYLDDLEARVSKMKPGEYLKVGRIQYADNTAEILIGAGSTKVIFASLSKEKIDSIYEYAKMWIVPLNKYGIKLSDKIRVAEVRDKGLLRALTAEDTLHILDANEIGRFY